jgi:hypothetical protein
MGELLEMVFSMQSVQKLRMENSGSQLDRREDFMCAAVTVIFWVCGSVRLL